MLGVGRGDGVIDLGAGTGKLTAGLARCVDTVIAVEPLDAMRARLAKSLPQVSVVAGVAEEIPLPDGRVGAVFAGEAFHWFANPTALGEIRRVTRPGGGLALLWNLACVDSWDEPWVAEFGELIERHRPTDWRPYSSGQWRVALSADPKLGALQERAFPHVHHQTRTELLAMIRSWTWMAALDATELSAAMDEFSALLDHSQVTSIDTPYMTHVHAARWKQP